MRFGRFYMNIIFLELTRITHVEQRGIYTDLIRKLRDEGHTVYLVTASERRLGYKTSFYDSKGVMILSVKTLNIQKANLLMKYLKSLGLNLLLLIKNMLQS